MSMKPSDDMLGVLGEMEHDLADVTNGAKMLSVLSNSLLNQIDDKPIEKAFLNLKEILDGTIAIARYTVTNRAKLVTNIPGKKVEMVGCVSRLSQLVLNLLLNAADAIEPGRASDNKVILTVIPKKETVIIEIEDTGHGIAPENLDNIFTPLFTTKGKLGSGLGLAIVKKNVEDHGGAIEVSSTPGEGTVFKTTLPLGLPSAGAYLRRFYFRRIP